MGLFVQPLQLWQPITEQQDLCGPVGLVGQIANQGNLTSMLERENCILASKLSWSHGCLFVGATAVCCVFEWLAVWNHVIVSAACMLKVFLTWSPQTDHRTCCYLKTPVLWSNYKRSLTAAASMTLSHWNYTRMPLFHMKHASFWCDSLSRQLNHIMAWYL